jgi:hypothetical protein
MKMWVYLLMNICVDDSESPGDNSTHPMMCNDCLKNNDKNNEKVSLSKIYKTYP